MDEDFVSEQFADPTVNNSKLLDEHMLNVHLY